MAITCLYRTTAYSRVAGWQLIPTESGIPVFPGFARQARPRAAPKVVDLNILSPACHTFKGQ
jgi:hypothetical protein